MIKITAWSSWCTKRRWSTHAPSNFCQEMLCKTRSSCPPKRFPCQAFYISRWIRLFRSESDNCDFSKTYQPNHELQFSLDAVSVGPPIHCQGCVARWAVCLISYREVLKKYFIENYVKTFDHSSTDVVSGDFILIWFFLKAENFLCRFCWQQSFVYPQILINWKK